MMASVFKSNIDPGSKWSLVGLLKRLSMTKIIASHDLELVKVLCPRTVVLDRGHIIADGATDHILADILLLRAHGLASVEVT